MEATAVNALNTGDTAWMLVATAMVLFMIPGLALFYGGLARSKNMLGTMMHSFITMGAITLQWMVIGYSLAFGDGNAYLGGTGLAFLRGIRPESLHGTIPTYLFIAFQGAFACITPALISGAIAERIRFGAYIVFILLWSTLVYDPVCHWVWHPDGFLAQGGVIDFAGGIVVHLTSGLAGLAACIILGKRHGLDKGILPHNMVHVILGAGILWFGWFGFNAGSAVAANGIAGLAFLNTLPFPAMGLAAVTSCVCYLFVARKHDMGYDDALDAFGVHGIAGIIGPLACGLIASEGFNSILFHNPDVARGGMSQLLVQIKALGAVGGYSLVMTAALVLLVEKAMGFRVTRDVEEQGLDLSLHGEKAYNH